MKRLFYVFILILFLTTACSTVDVEKTTTATPTSTYTPSPIQTGIPTVTSTPTPTPTLTPTPAENTVVINPGDNIQAKINASPLETTFVFSTAVYERVSIRPRTGDIYIGQDSILDGMGVYK